MMTMTIVSIAPAIPASMYGVIPASDVVFVSIHVLMWSAATLAIMPMIKPNMAIMAKVFILLLIYCSPLLLLVFCIFLI